MESQLYARTMTRRTRSLRRRVREVGPAGIWLLVKAFFLMLAARIALRSIPVKKIIAWKQRPLRGLPDAKTDAKTAERCAQVRWAVLVAARYSPIDFVCFPQCLAAAELLRGAGIPSRLHYGVTRENAKLMTHTWLEAADQIVIGGEVAEAYSTLDIY
jgi:Transglutaminase-like superfamily